jgi:hypothetical protein
MVLCVRAPARVCNRILFMTAVLCMKYRVLSNVGRWKNVLIYKCCHHNDFFRSSNGLERSNNLTADNFNSLLKLKGYGKKYEREEGDERVKGIKEKKKGDKTWV